MNEIVFNEALNYIDEKYIEEYFEQESKKRTNTKRPLIKRLALAACIVVAFIIGFALVLNNTSKPVTISSIDNDEGDANGAPTLPDNFVVITKSAFANGEKAIVNVGMGGAYKFHENDDEYASYSSYGITGYPVLVAYERDSDISNGFILKEGSRVIIEGVQGDVYKRILKKEDMVDIMVNTSEGWKYVDPEFFHYETLELDFSNVEIGESGVLYFAYDWEFFEGQSGYDENGYRTIAYYKGEYGVGLCAYPDVMDAKRNYWSARRYCENYKPEETGSSTD